MDGPKMHITEGKWVSKSTYVYFQSCNIIAKTISRSVASRGSLVVGEGELQGMGIWGRGKTVHYDTVMMGIQNCVFVITYRTVQQKEWNFVYVNF